MDRQFTQDQKYILVRKRVEKISKFYKHVAIYFLVNIFLTAIFIAGDINNGAAFSEVLFDNRNYKIWMYWGILIAFQALNTFGLTWFFNEKWEERKIKSYMKEQNNRR